MAFRTFLQISRPACSRGRSVLLLCFVGLAAVALFLTVADVSVGRAAQDRSYADLASLPARTAGVIPGCSRLLTDGRRNLYFAYRIESGARIFHAGKVDYLVVSGDNHRKGYDEPTDMRDALVAAGVPEDRIYRDYAGFRTLDTVVRAREVFGLDAFVFISQPFHNERGVYLARHHGIDAIAFEARDVRARYGLRTRAREVLARAKAVADIHLLRTKPKFLGDPVALGDPVT